MEKPPPPSAPWLPCAHGLRATAASLVFLHHASFLTGATVSIAGGAFFARFDIGVPIFFALSGFLLARPYVEAILDGRPLPSARRFYRRRALRILPAYWVALTATYLWLRPESAEAASGADRVWHYLLLQIYPSDALFPRGISPAWTLAVEASFYAALPVLAMLAARLVRGMHDPSPRAILLLGALAAGSLLSLAWRTLFFASDELLQALMWLPATFSQFAVGIAAAVLVAWSARRTMPRSLTEALGRFDLLWWTAAALLLVFQSTQIGLERTVHANWNRELYSELIRIAIAAFLLLPVAFGPQHRGVVRAFLRSWPIRSLGVVSYGVFLWHVPLIESALGWTGSRTFLDWNQPGMGVAHPDVWQPVALAFALAVLAGTISWFALERPLLGRRPRRGSSRALQATEAAAP
jgi:peptidoglycan/LPS O-acetylase OafA/YrhL